MYSETTSSSVSLLFFGQGVAPAVNELVKREGDELREGLRDVVDIEDEEDGSPAAPKFSQAFNF